MQRNSIAREWAEKSVQYINVDEKLNFRRK